MRQVCAAWLAVLGLVMAGCSSFNGEAPAERQDGRREARQLPGVQPDGAVRLPNQWSLRPMGKQFLVGDFPVNIALHPSGKFAAVLHCGNGRNEIIVLEI